jgi:uncharacterized protein with HEPN domain
MSRQQLYLLHALDCIQRIERYTADGQDVFLTDTKTQDAVIRNLEVIGQCVKDYGADRLVSHMPDIPWDKVAGTRNVLAHEYLGVDIDLIWEIIASHLNDVKNALELIVEE